MLHNHASSANIIKYERRNNLRRWAFKWSIKNTSHRQRRQRKRSTRSLHSIRTHFPWTWLHKIMLIMIYCTCLFSSLLHLLSFQIRRAFDEAHQRLFSTFSQYHHRAIFVYVFCVERSTRSMVTKIDRMKNTLALHNHEARRREEGTWKEEKSSSLAEVTCDFYFGCLPCGKLLSTGYFFREQNETIEITLLDWSIIRNFVLMWLQEASVWKRKEESSKSYFTIHGTRSCQKVSFSFHSCEFCEIYDRNKQRMPQTWEITFKWWKIRPDKSAL